MIDECNKNKSGKKIISKIRNLKEKVKENYIFGKC